MWQMLTALRQREKRAALLVRLVSHPQAVSAGSHISAKLPRWAQAVPVRNISGMALSVPTFSGLTLDAVGALDEDECFSTSFPSSLMPLKEKKKSG